MSFAVNVFAPIALRLLKVGPFQAKEVVLRFDDDKKTDPKPTNLYLIAGMNGLGKTTILESIVACLGLLEGDLRGSPPPAPEWLTDHPDARLQLDVLVELVEQSEKRRGVLSLVLCEEPRQTSPGLHYWTGSELTQWGASFHARLTVHSPSGPRVWEEVAFDTAGDLDDHAVELVRGLRDHIQRAKRKPIGDQLMAPTADAPSVLMFTSHRDLAPRVPSGDRFITQPPEWSHSLVRRFDNERGWLSSLDALLVYLDYIDGRRNAEQGEPRFNEARKLLNEHLFIDEEGLPTKTLLRVDREQMATVIEVKTPSPDGGPPMTTTHGLDRLSSGEKAFAQILVRLATHMTKNTLVLIDEADLHLHPSWERSLMASLKRLVRRQPGLRCFVATHSNDMITIFDVHRDETSLTKDGFIVNDETFAGRDGEHEDE